MNEPLPNVPRTSMPAAALLVALLAASTALAAPPGEPARRAQGPGRGGSLVTPQRPQAAGDADPGAVTAADSLYSFVAARVEQAPEIDGVLDDPVWSQAAVVTGFVQAEPDEGRPASERTEVRVVYDDRAIYIAAVCYDREPERITATVLRRDEDNNDNDAFMVTLDTYHDHRNAYFFETNPMGARYDAQIVGEGGSGGRFGSNQQGFNSDWDAVWQARSRITDQGWITEMAIPFVELRFETDQSAWGINFRRTIRRKTEKDYWAPVPRQFDHTRLSLSGMLQEMHPVRARNIQVTPFVIGGVNRSLTGGPAEPAPGATYEYENDLVGDVGGDGKWGITPNLTLDMTINTDFSQVEADDEQVNLTRFSLFFPEKRDFFLENAGYFDFGGGAGGRGQNSLGGGAQVVGFHSRTIGIGPDNREIPLYGGTRITGKVGPWAIGALAMQSEATTLIVEDELHVPSNNYVVGRLTRDLGSRSRAGVLFTNRQAGGDDYNRELGFDGRWGINASTTVDAWWMKTFTPGLDGEDQAGQLRVDWSSSLFQARGSYVDVGENFRPEMGFVNRTGIRFFDPSFYWTPYFPESRWVRNLNPHTSLRYTYDHAGNLISRYVHLDWDMTFRAGDHLSVKHNREYELLDEIFEISEGVVILPGVYEWSENVVELRSDAGRPVNATVSYTRGGFWSGDRTELRLEGGWRPGARFNLRLSWTRNDIDLPEGAFATDLASLRIGLDFTPDISLGGLIQYNSQSDQALANLRLRYIYAPGSDLYVVYNERRVAARSDLIDRTLIVKVTRLFRF